MLLLLLVLLRWRARAIPKSATLLVRARLRSEELAINFGAARPAKIRSAVLVELWLGAAAHVELNSFAASAQATPLHRHGSAGRASCLPAGGSS